MEWIDADLSRDLPTIAARGEGQASEFIVEFPQQARELAKEIAAFATSNAGTILLGVENNGDIVGLGDVENAEKRDLLLQRIEGICNGTVNPAITPQARWAKVSGRTVLVLSVPKGRQPVYYAANIPYLRHLTASRPAQPHEVIELIRESFNIPEREEEEEEHDDVLSAITRIIVDVLIYSNEADHRLINPWFDLWRAQFNQFAQDLREIAVEEEAIVSGYAGDLDALASALDYAANMTVLLGSGPDITKAVANVNELAAEFRQKHLANTRLSSQAVAGIKESILKSVRSLEALVGRADALMDQGRTQELQAAASNIGLTLLRASYYEGAVGNLADILREVGFKLHLTETEQMELGGHTHRALKQTLIDCFDEIALAMRDAE